MSEFECRKGHPLNSGEMFCGECGSGLYTMDGMTDYEIKKRDKEEPEDEEDNENE